MTRLSTIGAFSLLSWLLLPVSAQAQQQNSLLWKVEGKSLTSPSYIYGTIHYIGKDDFFLRDEVTDALSTTASSVFEIALDDQEEMSTLTGLLMLPPGTYISDFVTPEEYERIDRYLMDSLGQSIMLYRSMKPFVLGQSITAGRSFGTETESYEMVLMEMAQTNNKKIYGLESVADQVGFMDSIPYDVQLDWTLEALDHPGEADTVFPALVRYYKAEDLEGMLQCMLHASPEIQDYGDLLLYNRNATWIPVMEDMMEEESRFFAVGAGHLPGPKGVLTLLREAGYTVTPVNNETHD